MNSAVEATLAQLRAAWGEAPEVAVILGSGWAGLQQHLHGAQTLAYADLSAFAPSQVEGHRGELALGSIGRQRVLLLCGRSHTYESGDCAAMAGAIASLSAWGVRVLIQTNAAGSLRADMPPGSLMLIADHINAPQRSPLVGLAGNARFVDLSAAYDPALRQHALQLAHRLGLTLHQGTYLWALGPQFETPAEIRMFAAWGADAVGMSTVPETILARHLGLRVLGLSLLTNFAAGLGREPLSHAATLRQADATAAQAQHYLGALLASLAEPPWQLPAASEAAAP
ncbi:MAG: purine-nucleoside phosphorylase [Rhodoferax sp.]